MDLTTIAQDVLAHLANEGIALSEDLGQAETVLREPLLKIGAAALEQHLGQRKLGYEGSSRACACGRRQQFVEYRPKTVATLLGTWNMCGRVDAGCMAKARRRLPLG